MTGTPSPTLVIYDPRFSSVASLSLSVRVLGLCRLKGKEVALDSVRGWC